MRNLAIDIGSRFADLAFSDGEQTRVLKSSVSDQSEGAAALSAIDAAVQQFGFDVGDLSSVRIGSTGALNAVLQRKGARVALLATEGFTDTFFLARQNRQDLYNPVAASRTPSFLLNESDIHSVPGRIGADGIEVTAPDLNTLAKIADQITREGVDAVAVCLLFAHLNPAHELACLQALTERCPDLHVSLSHRVDPQPREYERTVSVCLDAWLKPRFSRSVAEMTEGLAQKGFRGQLLFGDGRGALMSTQTALQLPSTALASGPAAAARYAATITARGPARPRLILDIGSVSCDLSFAPVGAAPPLVSGAVYGGVSVRREMIDLHSFSLGARHVAVLYPDKRLAFELRDSTDLPTLELALRACGRVDPVPTLSDLEPLTLLAEQAGWTNALDAARHIIMAAELEIASAVVDFAVRRNIDPAHAQLVAMGGVGPLLAAGVAQILSIHEILLPQTPAAAGALGLLNATARLEATTTLGTALTEVTPKLLAQLYASLMDDITLQPATLGKIDLAPPTAVFTMAATAQMHPMQIEITPPPQTSTDIADAFRSAYQTRYAITPPGDGHIFSALLTRDSAKLPTPTSSDHEATVNATNPERFETSAGTLHIPTEWDLSKTEGGFSLQIKEPRT